MIQMPMIYDYNSLSSQIMTMQLIAQSITGSVFSNTSNNMNFSPFGFSYGGFPIFGNFNTGLFALNTSKSNSGKLTSSSSESSSSSTVIKDKAYWENLGYNASKGQKLSNEAKKGSPGKFLRKCATYVKKAIERAGLGAYKLGNGCDMENAYADNKNFKKISGKGINPKNVPAGVIAVFEAGKSGYHSEYGHTEISNGDGTYTSDGTTRNPREASWYLVPV